MAQPTVTARPATWAGTSGPILYKFTSTNYANAGYYMAVEIWDSVAAAKIADGKYYSNSSGSVVVDVSAFLRSNLSLDLEADLTSGVVYEDINWMRYYIKYQEIWTASSESKVDDVANLRYAVYGGLQIGSANNFSDYIPSSNTKKFLTYSDLLTSVSGYNFLLSIIGQSSPESRLKVAKYKDGVSVSTTYIDSLNDSVNLIRLNEAYSVADTIESSLVTFDLVQFLLNSEFTTNLDNWTNEGSGSDWTQTSGTAVCTLISPTFSKELTQSFATRPAGEYQCDVSSFASALAAVSVNFVIQVYNGISLVQELLNFNETSSSLQSTGVIEITGEFDSIVCVASRISGDFVSAGLDYFRLSSNDEDDTITETKTINILEDCQNIVMLAWRNSTGGWECYPFTCNQEETYHYSDRKAKRQTLFAEDITASQWEAIQGLNTLGELYKTPLIEMTTSLNRTSATIGQSVYVLNADGTKIGVNVIGQPNTIQTRRKRHSAFVTIEYPELLLQ